MSFNVINRDLRDLDELEEEAETPSSRHQFEQLMNEGRFVESEESDQEFLRYDYVFMDNNQNILLIRNGSLYIYKMSDNDREVLIEKIPESKHRITKSMTAIR